MIAAIYARILLSTGLLAVLLPGCAELVIYDAVQGQSEIKKARAAGTFPPAELGRECQQEATTRRPDGNWGYDPALQQACLARHGWVLADQQPSGNPLLTTIPVYKYIGLPETAEPREPKGK
jgi:hypothetical protein